MWKTWLKIWPFTFVQRYRVLYEEYDRQYSVDKNYVFHMSSLWLNADWDRNDELFNEANARFISACQRIPEINFDGGLSMSSKEHCSPSLRNFACEGSFSVKEYLEKTGKSFVVFNASFSNHAHGWKLGEFLALGKAITPSRQSTTCPNRLCMAKTFTWWKTTNSLSRKLFSK